EVLDATTGKQLSQKSCAVSVIFQNDPPFLVAPSNGSTVTETNPQNIIFQWTPRSINVTNVEYELSLVEIWDNVIDPQAAFLSSPPIFQTTTTGTTYIYGPGDPLLLSGKRYAWRVKSKAKQGTEEIGLFKNQGHSEIFSFTYAGNCELPMGLNHEVKGSTNANIIWEDLSTDVPEYTVRYRKKGKSNAWFISKTTTNQLTLWDLKAGTTYEYQLQKKCAVTGSDWSMVKQFTTFIVNNQASMYECGIVPNFSLTNKEPLPTITSGEQFTAGDFPITLTKVSGENGRFSGQGYVTIPYLNSIKVAVKFTNVLINTEHQLAEGMVITKYDREMKNILDVDAAIDVVTDAYDAVADLGDTVDNILRDVFGEESDDTESKVEEEFVNNSEPNSNYEGGTTTIDKQVEAIIPGQDNSAISDIETNNNLDSTAENLDTSHTTSYASDNPIKTDLKQALISYKVNRYKDGDIIDVAYRKNLDNQSFEVLNIPEDAKIVWSTHANIKDSISDNWVGNGTGINLDLFEYETIILEAKYWSPASTYPDGEPNNIRVGIRVIKKQFELKELYARHSKRRLAKSGQKLYLLNKVANKDTSKNKTIAYSITTDIKIRENNIGDLSLQWYYGKSDLHPKNKAKINIERKINLNDDKTNTTVRAGYPIGESKSIDIVWVDPDYQKFGLTLKSSSNPIIKKALEATEMTKRASKFFDKIPFIKKAKSKGAFQEGKISWYFDIIPFEVEKINKEEPNSRFYYTEKKVRGGFKAGLKGETTIWTWGVPYDKLPIPKWAIKEIKDVLTAEINVVAKADVTGSLIAETTEKKTVGSEKWQFVSKNINPASLALNAAFGVEGELSAFEGSDWLSFEAKASGLAKAELISVGWHGDDFNYHLLREGIWMDFRASMYIVVMSKKLETKPYYKKIQLMEPINHTNE
ncbi:MAG: fibronectin type III domain-containing protein, partial [Arenibacter latericius]|nr:fibronectin type III domain-containing protein [Arenibacter latericius]